MAQPTIEGTGHGKPVMIFWHNGTAWIVPLVDAAGHPQVDIISSALPSDAATETTLDAIKTAVELIDDLRGALDSVGTDEIRVEGKDGDKLFGFESVVEEAVENTALAAGTNNVDGAAVGSGKVWKITHVWLYYVGTAPTTMNVRVMGLAGGTYLITPPTPAAATSYFWNGEIYMQVDDYLRIEITGATLNDDVYMRYCGVQMNAP